MVAALSGQVLADWLRAPPPPLIRERQADVEQLRPRLDLREDLAALGDAVRAGLHAEALRCWGGAPAVPRSGVVEKSDALELMRSVGLDV